SLSRAYSRHSTRTSHVWHTRLASRVEPPFSGKEACGSVWAHKARSCQLSSSVSARTSCRSRSNDILEITCPVSPISQARVLIFVEKAPVDSVLWPARDNSAMHITVLGGGAAGAQFLADLGRVAGSDV